MKVLDLFSGIGGFSLGLERAGMETVAFCEYDPFCQEILKKHWSTVPVYKDIKELNYEILRQDGIKEIDIICGGFPCQDISVAGKQQGITAERSGLWKEFARLIEEIRPSYAIIENVANLRNNGLTTVLQDLRKIGYDAEWHIIPASSVGAFHQKERLWVISYPNSERLDGAWANEQTTRFTRSYQEENKELYWKNKSKVHRMVNGVSRGLDYFIWKNRVKSLGNSIVPHIAENIGKILI